jgi:nitrite reductase/ring-hydroxylating ferredoxin subunit
MKATVATLDEFPIGTMKLVRVEGHKVCLVRTTHGVFALDSGCPHEGYGLTQGTLKDGLLTCQWHNWKFDVTNGECVQGEEHVRSHTVTVSDGVVVVEIADLDPEVERRRIFESLRRGVENNYGGQIARDTIRLLDLATSPVDIVTLGIVHGVARTESGWGHDIALATDCLALATLYEGRDRAHPIVQALGGIAENAKNMPLVELPTIATEGRSRAEQRAAFLEMIEAEETVSAQTIVLTAIASGTSRNELLGWFVEAAAAHHLSYGHGAIYVQKAFEFLDQTDWAHADLVLGHLVPTITTSTREDLLPYMRAFMSALANSGLSENAPVRNGLATHEADSYRSNLTGFVLNNNDSVVVFTEAVKAVNAGVGLSVVLDAAVDATALRMLRYDTATEFDHLADFGWLDLTHGITYAHAIRWCVDQTERETEPDHTNVAASQLTRLALFALFLAHYTGRHEHSSQSTANRKAPNLEVVDVSSGPDALLREAISVGGGFLFNAHVIKTMYAATREHDRRPDSPVLQAATRFMRAPKLQHRLLRETALAIAKSNQHELV